MQFSHTLGAITGQFICHKYIFNKNLTVISEIKGLKFIQLHMRIYHPHIVYIIVTYVLSIDHLQRYKGSGAKEPVQIEEDLLKWNPLCRIMSSSLSGQLRTNASLCKRSEIKSTRNCSTAVISL